MKRHLLSFVLLAVLCSSLAGKNTYTWQWNTVGSDVNFVRVRVDDGPYTVLDASRHFHTSAPLPPGEHFFTISQSRDGIHWGPEVKVSSSLAKKKHWSDPSPDVCNSFRFTIAPSLGANFLLTNHTHPVNEQVTNILAGLDIGFHNIIPIVRNHGISLMLSLGWEPYPTGRWSSPFSSPWKHSASGTGVLSYEYSRKKWSASAGVGGFLSVWLGEGFARARDYLFHGLVGNARFAYNVTPSFFIASSATFRFYLYSFYLAEEGFGWPKGPGAMTAGLDFLFGIRL